MGRIDFHAHLAAGDASKEQPFLRAMFDPDGYLEHQAASGIELTVLSNVLMEDTPGDELTHARSQHEFLAELVDGNPDRLLSLAAANSWGGQESFGEAAA